jgi:pyrroline-5-carboxylate reductase
MKISFIGGGNMASALIGGMLGRGHPAQDIAVVEVDEGARARMTEGLGVRCTAAMAEALPGSAAIVLAVKPQQLGDAARLAGPLVGEALVLSIAAGIRLQDIARWLGRDVPLVRAMPNTPALIRMGVTGLYARPDVSARQRQLAGDILSAAGKVVWLEREELIDAVTALSGSGPAYVFYFIESLVEAGVAAGLDAAVARLLSIETMRGAAELAARSAEDVAQLRERVTSKGGTTERAIASFDRDGVRAAIGRGVAAANTRAAELADEFGKRP